MKQIQLMLTAFLLCAQVEISRGADASVNTNNQSPRLVGDLGRADALVFEGNQAFSREAILNAMTWHIDFHIAAHRMAPVEGYLARLERKILLGYQRAGFGDARVQTTVATNNQQILVRIDEGTCYRYGNIRVTGTSSTNELVCKTVVDALTGSNKEPTASTNKAAVTWIAGEPAALDEFALQHQMNQVFETLQSLNYHQPKISVKCVPDKPAKTIDLLVEIADLGIKGTVEEIQLSGLRTNTPAAMLEFLGLQKGMDAGPDLVNAISNRLWHSARFVRNTILLSPLTEAGKFKLELDLEELDSAPPVNQEFSPTEKTLVKLHQWLLEWEQRPEDLVLDLELTKSPVRLIGTAALSRSGVALAFRTGFTKGSAAVGWAATATTSGVGLYSPWRAAKFAGSGTVACFQAMVHLVPSTEPGKKFNFTLGGGIHSTNLEGQPFRIDFVLSPAAFLDLAHRSPPWQQKDGMLLIQNTNSETKTWLHLAIDSATGHPVSANFGQLGFGSVRLHAEKGALARLKQEIDTASAAHHNYYATNSGLTSLLSYLAAELIESPLWDPWSQSYIDSHFSEEARAAAREKLARVKPFLIQGREVLRTQNFDSLVAVLERLKSTSTNSLETAQDFLVPMEDLFNNQSANPMMAMGASAALLTADKLLLRNTWPWVLLRESAFVLAGQAKYAQVELRALLQSTNVGPLGCLATATLVGRVDPKLARTFAERGLARLTADQVQKDYRALLDNEAILAQFLAGLMAVFGKVDESQWTSMTASLNSQEGEFLKDLGRNLRGKNPSSAVQAAWPAAAQHWETVLRPYIEVGLRNFLPQVDRLTDKEALYKRGLALISANAVVRDVDEALQCFRKAADQGHPGAHFELGRLFEEGQGVIQDFGQAIIFYQVAASKDHPHAGCRLADLYRTGRGVRKNLTEAAKWLEPEIGRKCSRAQYFRGLICDEQGNPAEAIQWFRRAAEAGLLEAMTALGNTLSDDLFGTPDYLEACQWLTLAGRAGDKMSEIRSRRVKSKLSPSQLMDLEKRLLAYEKRASERKQ